MPIEDAEGDDERRAKDGYDLARIRLNRLLANPDKPVVIPERKEAAKPKPPPDFVRNVVGSSAAAGSAEFHIYRNNRRKEMNRLNYLEKEYQDRKKDEEFDEKLQERRRAEEERTEKNRKKRLKRKQRIQELRKQKKRKDDSDASDSEDDSDSDIPLADNKDASNHEDY
ncbi:unnamed protein product [Bursaphelenchus xylophilus]|uniref:(pine wood nematode) hypothetical protein n=1 Tax=Bursaphelenchus xylophilus TaxID=6326 RepID=A0A1I7SD67_BURXY|nr:unnamed protein product [Bursaphelenchus xylophilus]CAG9130519.1 unnamed protein product [Bursaphelenchus xylophilus]